ncbi:hypothetical protein [Mesorhizobium silamurunense]|uniref:hypothetical protein n=1 Tax=Mesorhizobium silamurunense TaxID=499528 RepID=UPI001782C8FB|nr:hypothetical protein [Mesorhizobium silamurunense]
MRSSTSFQLQRRQAGTRQRTEPNWADLAVELKKPGVTLLILWEEYRETTHPEGLQSLL